MISGGASCYLCGNVADDSPDHVPPEVLFRGVDGRSYKSPEIITVPSCREHNKGASMDDEILAWVMSDAGSLQSGAGFDVFQALFATVGARIYSDRCFADERLQRLGIRILRDPKDYDGNGLPKTQEYDTDYFAHADRTLRDRWSILKRSLQKVAAGLFYHATNGQSLGALATYELSVVVPEFKQVGAAIALSGLDLDETVFFSKRLNWQTLVSGSPDVFQCEISHHRGSKKFAMKMLFYKSIHVWIKTHKSDFEDEL